MKALPRRPGRRTALLVSLALALALGFFSLASNAGQRKVRITKRSTVATLRAPAVSKVLIPAGSFQMGSDIGEIVTAVATCRAQPGGRTCDALSARCLCQEEVFADEFPVHEVFLSAFELDTREVTVAQYERCVEAGPCGKRPTDAGGGRFNAAELPVTMVTFQDAVTFCKFAGGRLPTEAEWERAARGLTNHRYPWGNVWNLFLANGGKYALDPFEDRDGFLELAPPGSFPRGRTPSGLLDMAGNVEEWVADWFDAYNEGPLTDPKGPNNGDERVTRGGSYLHASPWLRAASRGHDFPGARRAFRGFRCAYDKPSVGPIPKQRP